MNKEKDAHMNPAHAVWVKPVVDPIVQGALDRLNAQVRENCVENEMKEEIRLAKEEETNCIIAEFANYRM